MQKSHLNCSHLLLHILPGCGPEPGVERGEEDRVPQVVAGAKEVGCKVPAGGELQREGGGSRIGRNVKTQRRFAARKISHIFAAKRSNEFTSLL